MNKTFVFGPYAKAGMMFFGAFLMIFGACVNTVTLERKGGGN